MPEAEAGPERRASEPVPARVWAALALGLVAIGASPLLVRYADEAPGLMLAAGRTGIAAVLVIGYALARARPALKALDSRDLLWTGVAGVLLGLHFIAWIESLYHTSVASASVLVTSSPLFIAVLGFVILRERLSPRTLLALGVGVGGAALIGLGDASGGSFPRSAWGNALALGAAALVAGYLLIGRAVRQRRSLLAYLVPVYLVAALVAVGAALLAGVDWAQSPKVWALCAAMAVGPQLIGHGAFNYAVRYLPAAVLGLFSLAEPVLASLGALLLFREVPSGVALGGMGLVVLALVIEIRRAR